MNSKIDHKYLKDDDIEIRVFSKDLEEQKQLDIKNRIVLERGLKTIKNTKEIHKGTK